MTTSLKRHNRAHRGFPCLSSSPFWIPGRLLRQSSCITVISAPLAARKAISATDVWSKKRNTRRWEGEFFFFFFFYSFNFLQLLAPRHHIMYTYSMPGKFFVTVSPRPLAHTNVSSMRILFVFGSSSSSLSLIHGYIPPMLQWSGNDLLPSTFLLLSNNHLLQHSHTLFPALAFLQWASLRILTASYARNAHDPPSRLMVIDTTSSPTTFSLSRSPSLPRSL